MLKIMTTRAPLSKTFAIAPVLALMVVSAHLRAFADPDAGRIPVVAMSQDFELSSQRTAWTLAAGTAWREEPGHGWVLEATQPEARVAEAAMGRLPFDLTPYRGRRLRFDCRVRAKDVSRPAQEYLGVKFMLHYRSPADGPFWINPNGVHGTFDWKTIGFSALIAADATGGELNLGLQGSSGSAWFDEVRVTVEPPPRPRPAPRADAPPPFRGHDLPRLRGVMSPNQYREEDLRVLGREWKANVIRWQITRQWGKAGTDRDLAEYDRWFDAKLTELDQALESCRRNGLQVVVDVHSPPGGRHDNKDVAMFYEPEYQHHWIELWEKMARRYRGHPAVWGYDLINEPVATAPPNPELGGPLEAQTRAARAIRAIDPAVPIFIEAAEWDAPSGFRDLEPVPVSNLVYQVHMYAPGEFTHQGVHEAWKPVAYPGRIAGARWDRERIRRELAPVREFQLAYNTHIFVGEFSAIRWAPGAEDYLRDCIETFEEYGWDWTYHAFREWDGWSVEHGEDPADKKPAAAPTARQNLLRGWFDQNFRAP